jgi:hypothetical protein
MINEGGMLAAVLAAGPVLVIGGLILAGIGFAGRKFWNFIIHFNDSMVPERYEEMEEIEDKRGRGLLPEKLYAREVRISEEDVAKAAEAWKYTEKTPGDEVYYPPYEPPTPLQILASQYGRYLTSVTKTLFDFIRAFVLVYAVAYVAASWPPANDSELFRMCSAACMACMFFSFRIQRWLFNEKTGNGYVADLTSGAKSQKKEEDFDMPDMRFLAAALVLQFLSGIA